MSSRLSLVGRGFSTNGHAELRGVVEVYENGQVTGREWFGNLSSTRQQAALMQWLIEVFEIPADYAGELVLALIKHLQNQRAAAEQPSEDRGEGGLFGNETRKSPATVLVELVEKSGCGLWHDPDDRSWATITIENHQEHWPIGSRGFRRWLKRLFYESEGKTPGSQAVQDALGVLEGKCVHDGPEYTVHIRLAEQNSTFYLDLADAEWRAVEVTPTGWQIITNPPVKFRRSRGVRPLPQPTQGGDINQLREFVNVASEDDWVLLLSWLIAALRPAGPYPVLVLHGEQGSAKSTLARLLRALVDPNSASLRVEPRDPRDLMIASTNGWVVNLDNLSRIRTWLSDGLCRLATGGGFATRELYTDSDEALFDAQRPVIINGIEELATRGDLLDRAIILYLPAIPKHRRKAEAAFWESFGHSQPHILGALLTAVTHALANIGKTKLAELPRMADFAEWGVAALPALGFAPDTFINAYTSNRESANALTLDASLVAQVLLKLPEDTVWEDTATTILERLNNLADEGTLRQKYWPKNGRTLSNMLRRLAPNLREVGVEVEFHREAKTGRRLITIRTGVYFIVTSVTQRHPVSKRGDDRTPGVTLDESPDDAIVTPIRAQGDAGDEGDDKIHPCSNDDDDLLTEPPTEPPKPQSPESGGAYVDAATPSAEETSNEEVSEAADGYVQDDDKGFPYQLITSPTQVPEMLQQLAASTLIGLDIETYGPDEGAGLDPHRGIIRLVQLSTGTQTWVVDCQAVPVGLLGPLLESGPTKIIHNSAFESGFFKAAGIAVGPVMDTLVLGRIANVEGYGLGKEPSFSLKDMVPALLGITLDKEYQQSDWSGALSKGQLDYAAHDAQVLLPLYRVLQDSLQDQGLQYIADLEGRILPMVNAMTQDGTILDMLAWIAQSDRTAEEARQTRDQLDRLLNDLRHSGDLDQQTNLNGLEAD